MTNNFRRNNSQQNIKGSINVDKIIENIIDYDKLNLKEKYDLLNKESAKFVETKLNGISRSKFRKYFDIFINAIEKEALNEEKITKKKETYEKALLKCIILAKYDSARREFKNIENFYEFLKKFTERVKEKSDEEFTKHFENLYIFLEACVAYMKER
jgi:CRISPR type III-A-associated protein Csm2